MDLIIINRKILEIESFVDTEYSFFIRDDI